MPRKTTTLYEEAIKQAHSVKYGSKTLAQFLFRDVLMDASIEISGEVMNKLTQQAVNRAALYLQAAGDDELLTGLLALQSPFIHDLENPKDTADIRKHKELAAENAEWLKGIKGKSIEDIPGGDIFLTGNRPM